MADRVILDVIDRPRSGCGASSRGMCPWFLRPRPLAERGSLVGTMPPAPVLATAAAA